MTYFPKAPYMLSANTAWLEPNTTHKPLNDPAFRRALAESINITKIVTRRLRHLVLPASPTGLLPTWNKYIDKRCRQAYGFSYSTAAPSSDAAPRRATRRTRSGMFQNKDGSKIDLEISVPQGWSDWEAARDMIVASAKAAGIRIPPR